MDRTLRRPLSERLTPNLAALSRAFGLILICLWCLFPLYWMFITSLKEPSSIHGTSLFPLPFSFDSYTAIFSGKNQFGGALVNSVIISATTTAISLIVSISASYALARKNFRFKGFISAAILTLSMFPLIAILTPLFKLFTDIGWIDQFQAVIIPDLAFSLPLSIWILTSFFRAMPWELQEAALIDGCTEFRAFWRVILPLAAPGVFTTAILVAIGVWNEYLIASAMTLSNATRPTTVAIAQFSGAFQYEEPFGPQTAAGVIVTIPLVIVVLIFQRRIVAGLTTGGTK